MAKKLGLFFLLTGFIFSATAQNFSAAKIDSLLNTLAVNNKAMGSLALLQNGELIYQKAIGRTSLINGTANPANTKTRYRVGSISKMFTAVMIFQLIEENRLSFNTPLSQFFPQLPNADKITVGLMLDHRSGLHNYSDDPPYRTYMIIPHSETQMLDIVAATKPDFAPNTRASYSNTNFLLLGYIVEKLSGNTYSDALQQRIAAKIGLEDTYYGKKTNIINNEALSFKLNNDWEQQPETDMSNPGGAGAVVSTPADLVKFIDALFNGKLINNQYLDSMKTLKDGYGMAMFRYSFHNHIWYGHTGNIDSFEATLGYFPEEKLAFAYTANGTSVTYPLKDIINNALNIYFNKSFTQPVFKTFTGKASDLENYPGNFSTTQIAMKIIVTKNDNVLSAQAAGQPVYVLTALSSKQFISEAAGVILEFDATGNSFTLKHNTAVYKFTRDK